MNDPPAPSGAEIEAIATQLPKVELHCHLLGAMRPATAAALVAANGVELPVSIEELYARLETPPILGPAYEQTVIPLPASDPQPDGTARYGLLAVTTLVAAALRTRDDFARVAYEAQLDAFETSRVTYRELFFELGLFRHLGVDYDTIVDGLIEGLQAAADEVGIVGRLIAGIDRQESAGSARELVEELVAGRREEIVGIGLEGSELLGPPERFVEAYTLARSAGLHRCAHAGEHVPSAAYVLHCLDQLGCERIDHGYFLLEDDAAVERCRSEGVVFTCAFTTSRRSWIPWRRASIAAMVGRGLRVTLGSDDPAMFPTTLAEQFREAFAAGLSLRSVLAMARNGIDASFASPDERRRLRRELEDAERRIISAVSQPSPS